MSKMLSILLFMFSPVDFSFNRADIFHFYVEICLVVLFPFPLEFLVLFAIALSLSLSPCSVLQAQPLFHEQ